MHAALPFANNQEKMTTAEFIETNTEEWLTAERVVVNKTTTLGSPDMYVGIDTGSSGKFLFEIHTFEECICFKSIKLFPDSVVFGFGEHVHFFNISSTSLKTVKVDTYFGYLYTPEDLEYDGEDFGVLVASAEFLHRFTPLGSEVWKSARLGIDGVTVSKITYPCIEASGEWDPPGGWKDVKINLETGLNAI